MKSDPVEGKPCAGYISSGERMLAGAGCVLGGRTPAKPLWSEVMIILCDFLRQKGAFPEVGISSDEWGAHRKTDCASELSSCERMFAGGGSEAGGCTSAKPRWSEVMIILCDFLRQGSPSQEENK